jgi:hypothetical protein
MNKLKLSTAFLDRVEDNIIKSYYITLHRAAAAIFQQTARL